MSWPLKVYVESVGRGFASIIVCCRVEDEKMLELLFEFPGGDVVIGGKDEDNGEAAALARSLASFFSWAVKINVFDNHFLCSCRFLNEQEVCSHQQPNTEFRLHSSCLDRVWRVGWIGGCLNVESEDNTK